MENRGLVRTRIKVCGITDEDDAVSLAGFGVDTLGFIFAKESPRYVDPEHAREIIRRLPPFVHTVGVFVNEDPLLVNDIAQYCSLTMVQLHGLEPPEYCGSIAAPIIKAIPVHDKTSFAVCEGYRGLVRGFLLDTYHPDLAGGTGKSFDWRWLVDFSFPAPFILAGGLNAENVEDAIVQTHPFAVDVNSGVESEPGRKDMAKVLQFISVVHKTDEKR